MAVNLNFKFQRFVKVNIFEFLNLTFRILRT
jgi:hypothetical protein